MGAWGTGPTQSDDYFDLLYEVTERSVARLGKSLARKVTSGSCASYGNEWRAAAALVIRMAEADLYANDEDLREHLDAAHAKLKALHDDGDWLAAWNSPDKIRQALSRELLSVFEAKQALLSGRRTPKIGTGIAARVAAVSKAIDKRQAPKATKSKATTKRRLAAEQNPRKRDRKTKAASAKEG